MTRSSYPSSPLSPETWAPGVLIPGTVYRVIRPIGSGGMGDVYEAEHELLGLRRAVKVLSRRLIGRDDLAERLRVEARALATLRHPNLVEVQDMGVSSDGRVYFTMELLVGAPLRDVLHRYRTLRVGQACDVAAQVLDALGAAHARGMVHRDVKPENVFIQQSGRVKLLDFGIAKAVDGAAAGGALTAAGMAVGTPRYMAPEQAEGRPVDARTDIYSVGLLVWEMLVGRQPFGDLDHVAAAVAAVTKGVASLESMGHGSLPDVLRRAVARATSRHPGERFGSAAEFATELRRARDAGLPPRPAGRGRSTLRLDETGNASSPPSQSGATVALEALGPRVDVRAPLRAEATVDLRAASPTDATDETRARPAGDAAVETSERPPVGVTATRLDAVAVGAMTELPGVDYRALGELTLLDGPQGGPHGRPASTIADDPGNDLRNQPTPTSLDAAIVRAPSTDAAMEVVNAPGPKRGPGIGYWVALPAVALASAALTLTLSHRGASPDIAPAAAPCAATTAVAPIDRMGSPPADAAHPPTSASAGGVPGDVRQGAGVDSSHGVAGAGAAAPPDLAGHDDTTFDPNDSPSARGRRGGTPTRGVPVAPSAQPARGAQVMPRSGL